MRCPICHHPIENVLPLHADQFHETLYECSHCQASWSAQHNLFDMFKDPQGSSFLGIQSQPVEGDDFCWAV